MIRFSAFHRKSKWLPAGDYIFLTDLKRGYGSHLDFIIDLLLLACSIQQLCQIYGHFESLYQLRGIYHKTKCAVSGEEEL